MIKFKLLFLLLLLPYFATAQSIQLQNKILTIHTTGIAFLGSGMTEDSAKIFAIKDAKRKAVEQAGTYLESHTTILNYQLKKDEVITYASGLVQLKILSSTPKLVQGRFAIEVKIRAKVDTSLLNNRVKKLQRDDKLKQLLEKK